MQHATKLSAVLVAALVLLASVSMADVPKRISYQGWLTDLLGNPLDTTLQMDFAIYDAFSGGNEKWDENSVNVTVHSGAFSVILGAVNAIPDSVFDGNDRWLEVTVGTETMTPRTRLTSAAYAYRVNAIDGALGGGIAGDLAVSGKGSFGPDNSNSGSYSFVAGNSNLASGAYSTIGGGLADTATGQHSTVAGGLINKASGSGSAICGGEYNRVMGHFSFIGGGFENEASSQAATVSGGSDNHAEGHGSTVSGGWSNRADSMYATVAGGNANTTAGHWATVGGGSYNTAADNYATVSGGHANIAAGEGATVGGGDLDTAAGNWATVGGGSYNTADSAYSTVSGGSHNVVRGYGSAIPGGWNNTVLGKNSMAFGNYVYLDGSSLKNVAFFGGYSYGKLGVNRDSQNGGISYPIHVGGNVYNGNGAHVTSGGVWTNGSSRESKENFQALEPGQLLSKISMLPVESWQFKESPERHIGPTAEDFVGAFDVGTVSADGVRENRYLAASDVAGVALLGVKELLVKNEELELDISKLRASLAEMETLLKQLTSDRR